MCDGEIILDCQGGSRVSTGSLCKGGRTEGSRGRVKKGALAKECGRLPEAGKGQNFRQLGLL